MGETWDHEVNAKYNPEPLNPRDPYSPPTEGALKQTTGIQRINTKTRATQNTKMYFK